MSYFWISKSNGTQSRDVLVLTAEVFRFIDYLLEGVYELLGLRYGKLPIRK